MPPRTTMERTNTVSKKVKLSGDMNAYLPAKKTPAMPAQEAPKAKARIFIRTTFIPMAEAAISSSLMAIQARPVRELLIRVMITIAKMARDRIK